MCEVSPVHIGPVIKIDNAEKVESDERINIICCFCKKELEKYIELNH